MRTKSLASVVLYAWIAVGCGDGSDDGASNDAGNVNNVNNTNLNNGNGPVGYFEYFTESAVYDATSNTVEIVGLFAPDSQGLMCSNLPVSELTYRIIWPDQDQTWGSFGHLFDHEPISKEEFDSRFLSMGDLTNNVQEFELPPVGWIQLSQSRHCPLYVGRRAGCNSAVMFVLNTEDGTFILDLGAELYFGSCGPAQCPDCLCDTTETHESCTADCGCGDGVLEAPEVCDGTDFGGLTCSDFGYTAGKLYCSGDCLDVVTEGCS
jgi:hypothetical protein